MTLLKVTFLHGCLSRSLHSTNGPKSCKVLQLDLKEIPLQQGNDSHALSTKDTEIVSLEIQTL